ncbi:hypothetical protein [Candidatus Flexifilum breve]|uniref:hypothetical protein n=1 Tax=Candidatus Flexifilum breve TaxID=3140694 RepID=UPI003313072F
MGLVAAHTWCRRPRPLPVGEGYASFVAVAQDASRSAWPTILAVAKAAGSAFKVSAIETRFGTRPNSTCSCSGPCCPYCRS